MWPSCGFPISKIVPANGCMYKCFRQGYGHYCEDGFHNDHFSIYNCSVSKIVRNGPCIIVIIIRFQSPRLEFCLKIKTIGLLIEMQNMLISL